MTKNFYIKFIILFLIAICCRVNLYAQTNLSPNENVCEGELRTYRVEGNSGSTIFWSVTGGAIINDGTNHGNSFDEATVSSGSVFESIIQIQWGGAGNYQVTAREETPNSCISGDLILNVTVNPLPDITSLNFTVTTPVCYNSSPVLSVTGLSANTAYTIGYNDNGTSKTENIVTDGSGLAVLTTNPITANASYNIESVRFNDGSTNCEASPAPSLAAKNVQIDNVDPTLFCVTNQVKNTNPGQCDYTVAGTEFDLQSHSDDCAVASVVNDFNGGSTLNGAKIPVGTTTIIWTVTDNAGNNNSCSFDVTVTDNEIPTVTCPGNQTENYTASCNFILPDYTGLSVVSDNCDSSPVLTQSPVAGTVITTNTTITFTATDASGNSNNCTFDVVLTDVIAPVLSDLSDLSIIDCADDETIIPQVRVFASLALPAARYSDNCSATFIVQYRIQLPDSSFANNYGSAATGASVSDPSGFEFPEGESTVFFRVLDTSGNISNIESYTISVNHKPNPSEINF